jgi:F5/8 type C domain
MSPSRVLGATLAIGAVVRVLAVTPPVLDSDESWVGIAALNVLKGVFPYFFYGQPYMGGLEAYLQAVVVAVFGASRWSLKALPVAIAILFVYLSHRLATRLFDKRTAALVALAAACPGWLIITWAVKARLHYSLTPVLGLLLLLVAERIVARPDSRPPLSWFVLGLLGGIAWWNNYLAVIYLGAVGLVLTVTRFRDALAHGPRWALPGFLLGSLPLWVYNAQSGHVFVTPRGTWAPWSEWLRNLGWFATNTLPALIGVPREPAALRALMLLTLGGAAVAGLAVIVHRAFRGEAALALIPLVFLDMTVLVTASVYGEWVPSRYVFPLATIVPLVLGAGFGLVAARFPAAAWSLAIATAAVNAVGILDLQSAAFHPERLREFREQEAAERELFRTLRARGLLHVYSEDYGELNYVSGGSLVFARTEKEEPYPPFAELVDGALATALVSPARSAILEAGLAALGARYEVHRIPPWWVYHGFRLPHVRYEEIPPTAWSATVTHNARLAPHAFDRDVATSWRAPQRPGTAYTLDLGEPRPVGMVAWIPVTHRDSPRGLEVATSLDGARWHVVAHAAPYISPVYWSGTHPFLRRRRPRVEVRFAETAARYVRLTQLGQDRTGAWSIRELHVYRPLSGPREPDPASLDPIAPVLQERGVTRVYGDHWVLARLRVTSRGALSVLPVTVSVDKHGRTDLYRGWVHPPDYRRPEPLRLGPSVAVVLEGWVGTHPAFEALLASAGYRYRREVLGDYILYSAFEPSPPPRNPIERARWRGAASAAGEPASHALDGDRRTRWSTVGVTRQVPGLTFTLDLGVPTELAALELDLAGSLQDYPRGVAVAVSDDGERWEPVSVAITAVGPLYWTGTHALRGGLERMVLRFPARTTRFVRLEQTGHDPLFAWSMHEIRAYRPDQSPTSRIDASRPRVGAHTAQRQPRGSPGHRAR